MNYFLFNVAHAWRSDFLNWYNLWIQTSMTMWLTDYVSKTLLPTKLFPRRQAFQRIAYFQETIQNSFNQTQVCPILQSHYCLFLMSIFIAPPSYHKLCILHNLNKDHQPEPRTLFVWLFQFCLLFLTNELKKSSTLFHDINKKTHFYSPTDCFDSILRYPNFASLSRCIFTQKLLRFWKRNVLIGDLHFTEL